MYSLEDIRIKKTTKQSKSADGMKRLLINAIKMHALYTDGRIKIVESSKRIN
jgi:hypothetical protein